MADQYLRKWSLTVKGAGGATKDLSELRVKFSVRCADQTTPNTAVITIYNLADATVKNVIQEYTYVTLSAGYQTAQYGLVFQGTIKSFEKGHETVVDSFLRINAADGDLAHAFGALNKTLAAGWTYNDLYNALLEALKPYGISAGYNWLLTGGTGGLLPQNYRGRVAFGAARAMMADLAKTTGSRVSIQNGKLVVLPLNGFLPGTAVQLNAKTGLIGWPISTPKGITARCLINPAIQIGSLVQIDNASINQTVVPPSANQATGLNANQVNFPGYTDYNAYASVTDDGIYMVVLIDVEGDTRGEPWFYDLTCLAIDLSAAAGQQVNTDPNFNPRLDEPAGGV